MAEWVTFMLTAVMATVVMCRVWNRASSSLGKKKVALEFKAETAQSGSDKSYVYPSWCNATFSLLKSRATMGGVWIKYYYYFGNIY